MYKKTKCPICKEKELVRIIYGFPSYELFEMAEQGLVKLGGCCMPIGFDRNTHYCHNCKKDIEMYPKEVIFEYNVKSTFGMSIFQLTILKDDFVNVKYNSYDETGIDGFGCIDISKINELFDKYKDVFKIKDVPIPPVLDGIENTFYFKYNRKSKRISTFNIHYYNKAKDASIEASMLINFMKDIIQLLNEKKIKEDILNYLLFEK